MRGVKFRKLNAILKLRWYIHSNGGLPPTEELREYTRIMREAMRAQYNAIVAGGVVARGCRAPQLSSFCLTNKSQCSDSQCSTSQCSNSQCSDSQCSKSQCSDSQRSDNQCSDSQMRVIEDLIIQCYLYSEIRRLRKWSVPQSWRSDRRADNVCINNGCRGGTGSQI